MTGMTLAMILNRWPNTLDAALATLAPYVDSMVAVVDQNPAFNFLEKEQAARFHAVRYTQQQTLDRLRNESLALARQTTPGAWALVIDSDEFVEPQSALLLFRAITSATDVSAFLLPIHSYVGHGRWCTSYSFRLFRLQLPIRYSYEIHETISPSLLENGLRWEYLDAPIQHLDFVDPVPGKRTRYKSLLRDAIEKGDDLAFLKSLYAIEYFWDGDHSSAIRHLDEALTLVGDRRRHSRLEGKDEFPLTLKGLLSLHLGDLQGAQTLFTRLYQTGSVRAASEGALGLAWIASLDGDNDKVLEWIDASLERWPSAQAEFSRATVLCNLNQPHAALENLAYGLKLNPMAGDPRILEELNQESIFRWQSVLHPEYRGLPKLLRNLKEKIAASKNQH